MAPGAPDDSARDPRQRSKTEDDAITGFELSILDLDRAPIAGEVMGEGTARRLAAPRVEFQIDDDPFKCSLVHDLPRWSELQRPVYRTLGFVFSARVMNSLLLTIDEQGYLTVAFGMPKLARPVAKTNGQHFCDANPRLGNGATSQVGAASAPLSSDHSTIQRSNRGHLRRSGSRAQGNQDAPVSRLDASPGQKVVGETGVRAGPRRSNAAWPRLIRPFARSVGSEVTQMPDDLV